MWIEGVWRWDLTARSHRDPQQKTREMFPSLNAKINAIINAISYSLTGCSWWCPLARAPRSPVASGWVWNAGRGASCRWVSDAGGSGPIWMGEVTYSVMCRDDYCAFRILREAGDGSRPRVKLRAHAWWTEVRMTGRGVQESLYTPLPPALCIFNK